VWVFLAGYYLILGIEVLLLAEIADYREVGVADLGAFTSCFWLLFPLADVLLFCDCLLIGDFLILLTGVLLLVLLLWILCGS